MVVPNALNLKLPGKSQTQITAKAKPFNVEINRRGHYYVGGKRTSIASIESSLVKVKNRRQGNPVSITISPDGRTPNEYVVAIMDVAYRLEIDAIMTDPK